jgi:type I restriction enzyme M protein
VQPRPEDTVCDPAAGTGGFLLAAYQYVIDHHRDLDRDQKKHLRTRFVKGWELVPNTARLCIMNLFLHGIDADPCPVRSGIDSLAGDPGERFSLGLTNPPFGKKSSIAVVNEAGDREKDDATYERQDFWTTTKNKQLNFLQHVKTLLKANGRMAVTAAMPARRLLLPSRTLKPAQRGSSRSLAPEGSAYHITSRGRWAVWWLSGLPRL